MKLQFATSSESLDGRVSILDGGRRWNLKFLNICVKHFRLDIGQSQLGGGGVQGQGKGCG